MNNKSVILAGVMSLGLASLASATQYVYITGSTAGRGIVYDTLVDSGKVFDAAPTVLYSGGSSARGGTYVNFRGAVSGVDTIIKAHWSGSEGGIGDLVGSPATETFLTDDGSATTDSQAVDLAFADNHKNYSKNSKASITGAMVGIIPFKWVKQKGSAAGLTNVNDAAIRVALTANAKLALFTGVSTDTTYVYVSGRDNNSGTRVNALGECGYGIFNTVGQIQTDSTGAMVTQSDSGIAGDYGYSGGGSLASQMGYDLSQATSIDNGPLGDGVSHFSVIAYLGKGDADTAVANGGTVLSYNGIPYSIAAIKEGQYTFWGNEYLYKKNTGLSTIAGTVYTKLVNSTTGVPAHCDDSTMINPSNMHATRTGPTTDPIHK
jgi:hypothetical protein